MLKIVLFTVHDSAIPQDGRREAYAEAQAKAKAEEEALRATEKAREAAREAAEAAKKGEPGQETRAASLAEEAKEKAEAAGASVEGLLSKAKDLGAGLSWEKFSSQLATAVQKPTEYQKPKVQVATVRGQAKARSLQPKKAVVKLPTLPRTPAFKPKEEPKPKGKQPESKAEVRKVFGGLFKQETIYVDDD